MTFFQGMAYVMRHAWLWPLLFWLRPLEVMGGDGFSIKSTGAFVSGTHSTPVAAT